MEIVAVQGPIVFGDLLEFIRILWPEEWGSLDDRGMLLEYEKSSSQDYDVNKYLMDEGKRIGWYRYSAWPREASNKDQAHTFDIAVLPEYQGRGLGRLLMDDLIADCRTKGFTKLMSRTLEGNAASIALHKAAGFTVAFTKGTDIVWEIPL